MAIVGLASLYGAYGYRMVTAKLRQAGWPVNHKRVARIWREEGLKVPKKQKKRRHLWLADGSCVRLRPTHRNHVWSYDFVMDRLSNGKKFRMLTVIDEYTRECLAIVVEKTLTWEDVVISLEHLFILHGLPMFIRSDNGAEFTTPNVRHWLKRLGVTTMFIEPGSPWENGYNESFNGTIRRELLDREVFDTLLEAQVLIERWRKQYNHERPHSSLGYRPPAPEAVVPFEELVVKMGLSGERSKVEYCRLN
jgi:transposase InsO family protein